MKYLVWKAKPDFSGIDYGLEDLPQDPQRLSPYVPYGFAWHWDLKHDDPRVLDVAREIATHDGPLPANHIRKMTNKIWYSETGNIDALTFGKVAPSYIQAIAGERVKNGKPFFVILGGKPEDVCRNDRGYQFYVVWWGLNAISAVQHACMTYGVTSGVAEPLPAFGNKFFEDLHHWKHLEIWGKK